MRSLIFIAAMLAPIISLAMDNYIYKPTLQEIFKNDERLRLIIDAFEKEIISTKGDPEKINSLLRTETDGKNLDGQSVAEMTSSHIELIVHLRESKFFQGIRMKINKAVADIPKETFLESCKFEAAVAKLLTAVISTPTSLSYFAPILIQYETIIRANSSVELAQNKALSFFLLNIVNKVLCENALLSQEQENHQYEKMSDSNKKERKKEIVKPACNGNILGIASYLQKIISTYNPQYSLVSMHHNPLRSQINATIELLDKRFKPEKDMSQKELITNEGK